MTAQALAAAFVLAAGALALAAAGLFAREVLSADAGTPAMRGVADAVREGATAFMRRQYRAVAWLAAAVAAALFVLDVASEGTSLAWKTAIAFVLGAACSAGAGVWGMSLSVRANVRVASAARSEVRRALRLALRAGAAAALTIVASSLLGVTLLFLSFGGLAAPETATYGVVGFAFGASFVALFAQLGGGIYTKAADVGADLVGKVESGMPEDDPRNPAVIADLVGDNVGDCAGRGADLFESTAAENIGAMVLGAALAGQFGVSGVLFPLVSGAFGLLASIVGVLAARHRREEDGPMRALTLGYAVVTVLCAAGLYLAVRWLLGGNAWLFAATLVGLLASFAFATVARYYTSSRRRPTRSIAEASTTGAATNVLAGLAVAFECTALPALAIAAALLASYFCGLHALPGVAGAGVYGTAVATVGMLSTVGYVLSMDVFGPITDNAGGIAQMSGEPADVRRRTDALDAAGNTTKALTKGYAVGSAALAAFLLLSAYLDRVTFLVRDRLRAAGDGAWASFRFEHVDLGTVPVFAAALLGATAVFLFSALAIRAVGRAARAVVEEVRRQLREVPGLLAGATTPDSARCVDLVTAAALKGMLAPGLLAVGAPVCVGVVLRLLEGGPGSLLGAEAVAAVMLAGTLTGLLLALAMNTGGGAWDNAKKLVETGALGGERSGAHEAAIVGDTVGDPLKDTAGPSLHVLMKLFATVALVAAPLFVG